ncbi:hypothetical protein SteCoe_22350 [Stentor coeruleus]|uniref:EF-hand domain-containing protein n=1 Tax=Stentor coeruleus TaxID=5963 RepID=A0A1R2BMH9_9CILI|nr:hypothetical protein SteCoe_22350 [Stentor coeruleus]
MEPATIVSSTKWLESLKSQNWKHHLENPTDEASQAYSTTITFIASTILSKLETLHDHTEPEISALLKTLQTEFPAFLNNFITPKPTPIENLIQTQAIVEEKSISLEEAKDPQLGDDDDLQENVPYNEKHEANEEAVANLFARVLRIFTIGGRSLTELYQSLDISKDGKVTVQELRAELLRHDNSITIEECQAVFDILDGNKDGFITSEELSKRIKLIQDKAEAEAKDPLAHMVFSNPLDPNLIHGNVSVMLLRAQGLKAGTHAVKIRIIDNLEYTTNDTLEVNPTFNFRCEFFFENKRQGELPTTIEFDLLNKGKLEGTGTFQWQKAMKAPNEFSFKVKAEAKTSTGQLRGSLFFQVQWTPIVVKAYSEMEIQKLSNLKKNAEEYKKAISTLDKAEGKEDAQNFLQAADKRYEYEVPRFIEAPNLQGKPGAYVYMVKKSVKIVQKAITDTKEKDASNKKKKLNTDLIQAVAASKIQQAWKTKKK